MPQKSIVCFGRMVTRDCQRFCQKIGRQDLRLRSRHPPWMLVAKCDGTFPYRVFGRCPSMPSHWSAREGVLAQMLLMNCSRTEEARMVERGDWLGLAGRQRDSASSNRPERIHSHSQQVADAFLRIGHRRPPWLRRVAENRSPTGLHFATGS